MKTKLYLLRHSETNYNVKRRHDHEGKAMITENGKHRAEIIPELLAHSEISTIYSSPLPRCINTITPLANTLKQEIIIDDRIRENFFGPLQDKPWDDFSRDFIDEIHDVNGRHFEGYEHMGEVYKRVAEFIDSVIQKHPGETILICSHGGPIKFMLSHIESGTPHSASTEIPSNTGITHTDAYFLREI